MEGGQKAQVKLDSALDVKTGDMMSPVQDPRFTHNRQCWQGKVLPTSLRFEHDGWAVGRQVWQFPFENGRMQYVYTDVDERNLEQHVVAECDAGSQFQFLKQQWDTTDAVENFWWVDQYRVLVLTKDALVLRAKDGGLDDWNGDTFTDVGRWPRHWFITSDTKVYFCSSAYGGERARFITVAHLPYGFRVTVYDPLTMGAFQSILTINKHELGTVLNDTFGVLNTYSHIIPETVATQGKWTATCRNGCLVLGIHYDNNFNQWAVTYDLATGSLIRVIQGYGFVGVDGSLTGGEIPSYCFDDNTGFSSAVSPINTLKDTSIDGASLAEIRSCTPRIVGTEEQQWYIRSSVPSIVSHLVMAGTGHVRQELKLNNNYVADYASPSYNSFVIGEYIPSVQTVLDLLKPAKNAEGEAMSTLEAFSDLLFGSTAVFNALESALGKFADIVGEISDFALKASPLGTPVVIIRPSMLTANYLQQSVGQAAYVHYNSTSIYQQKDLKNESLTRNYVEEEWTHDSENRPRAEPISEDEVSFDRFSIAQEQEVKADFDKLGIFYLIAIVLQSVLEYGEYKLRVNATQNQTSTTDKGRRFSQFFLHNIASLAASDMGARSVFSVNNSEVTAVKALDMFYSTSDQQKICAGRGYVNHNFVAQCVAQSVTSVQSDFVHQRIVWIPKELSLAFVDGMIFVFSKIEDILNKWIDSYSGPQITGTSNTAIGDAMKVLLMTILGITVVVSEAFRFSRALIEGILEGTGMTRIHSSIAGYQTRHAYDVEGKHKYGSKSECFMWPCFGVDGGQDIVDESVTLECLNKQWLLDFQCDLEKSYLPATQSIGPYGVHFPAKGATTGGSRPVWDSFKGEVDYFIFMVKGIQAQATLPARMAYAIGAESFLPTVQFKNENIGESEPVFPTPPFQDYMIAPELDWKLSQTASVGMTTWVSCGDTKIVDGDFSNIVVSGDFCGVASPYEAVEVKRGITRRYLRPWAVSPNALSLNITGLNCCYERKAYHAFDGQGYRVVSWMGSPGMNKEKQTWLYSFLLNDRFKRSNKLPQNEYLGNYKSEPVVAVAGNADDKVFTLVTRPGENEGLTAGAIGEDKDARRYSLPVFSEFVSTLPAAVKTVTALPLTVIDGVTSLTSGNRDLQTAYKAPLSVDFTIGKQAYRYTQDFICSVKMERGVTVTEDVVPCLGLTYIGATPYEAYLYSPDTKMYYRFRGNGNLEKVDMVERFRNVKNGRYDFVRQEVLMPCLSTFERIDANVHDDADETDNVMVPRLIDGEFKGEVWPPLDTIYNTRSWFRTLSLPCGVTYQGPNRCIINRFTYQSYMRDQIVSNYGKWRKVPREVYHPFRGYAAKYERVDEDIGELVKVKGWTHNPFLLVTAPLGVNDDTDCMFEWEITFAWPVEMDELYGKDDYAVVNLQAQCMTPGGKVVAARPVHVFLTKELFTRTGNYGFYSFRYQSKCGIGNRERLHIWSDQYIAVSALQCEFKVMTEKRTEILTQQLDVERLHEI